MNAKQRIGGYRLWWLGSLSAGCLWIAACPGRLEDPDTFRYQGCPLDVPQAVFQATCGASDCHAAPTLEAELDFTMSEPALVVRLLDVPSRYCSGRVLIDSQDVADSYLLEALTQSEPGCTDPMPPDDPLSPVELDCVRDWVRAVVREANGPGGAGGVGGAGGATAGASS